MTGRRRRWLVTLVMLVVVASAANAWGYWTQAGLGSGAVSTASLVGATLSTPSTATNAITVTWAQQATLAPSSAANSSITYSVERQLGSGSFAAVSGGGCGGGKTYGITSCVDAPASSGSYSYRVVANYATWTATSAVSGPVALLVDTTPPTVTSIVRAVASPTNATSVSWTVTLSEAVSGVGTADFALARTGGVTGGAITGISGSGTTYTVTSTTGTGDGTLGLNLVDDDSITDAGANQLGGAGTGNGNLTGQTYTIDKTAPTLTSINRTSATPTNATSVSWTIIFSEAVTGVGTGDFAIAAAGPAGASISTVTGSGTTYTATAATGTGDGTLGLNLADDDSITDALTNKLGGAGTGNGNLTGQTYTIDKTAPTAPSAISATSGVVWGTTSCSVTTGTRYVNGTATSASASTVAMTANVTAETGLTIVFSATSGATNVTSSPLTATASPVTTTQNLSTLLNGTITLTAYTVDAAGNASTTATSTPVLIKDTVVPALTATYDGGFLGLDPTVSGASECGATVVTTKTFGGNVGATWQRTIASGTSYSIGVEGPLLGLGSVTYSTVSTDRAGNPSAAVVDSG